MQAAEKNFYYAVVINYTASFPHLALIMQFHSISSVAFPLLIFYCTLLMTEKYEEDIDSFCCSEIMRRPVAVFCFVPNGSI